MTHESHPCGTNRVHGLATAWRRLLVALALLVSPGLLAPAAQAQDGVVLKLVDVVTDPPDGMWAEVSDGHVRQVDPYYGNYWSEHSWNSPPKTIGAGGFDLTLSVKAENKVGGGITAGTGVGGYGFSFDKAEAVAWARVPVGKPGSDGSSLTVHVTPSNLAPGSTAELKIGGAWGKAVTYKYAAAAGTGGDDGEDDGDDGDDGDDDQPRRLKARIECDRPEIVISALPSLSCHILISGWQRNTSAPVFVDLPAAKDFFGNHDNGIQVTAGPGQQDVFNWDEPEYDWGLFVFACPSQLGAGVNCYQHVTSPGPVSVPIVVRQGDQSVNLTLSLTAVARGGQSGTAGTMRFGNSAMVGDFIHIEGGPLAAGAIKVDWLSALWSVEPVEGTEFVRLRSKWKPEVYIHAENQRAEAGTIGMHWWSAMWVVEAEPGTRFVRLGNRWLEGQYLHMENGFLELGAVDPHSRSALWWTLE